MMSFDLIKPGGGGGGEGGSKRLRWDPEVNLNHVRFTFLWMCNKYQAKSKSEPEARYPPPPTPDLIDPLRGISSDRCYLHSFSTKGHNSPSAPKIGY